MSKVYTYMLICSGLVLLFKFAGIPTGADSLMTFLGFATDASQVSMGEFFVAIAALFAVGTGTGIAISFITKSPSDTFLVAPLALGIFTVVSSTFISIINYTRDMDYVYYFTYIVFVPLLMGFGIAIIQFWRGTD